jgi:uncharacterized protein involved in type VI secretion and phage assembly
MSKVDRRAPVVHHGPSRLYGVYPGTVLNVADPDGQGRVQVQITASPDTGGEKFSVWARVATMMAGPQRGTWFIPAIADEVLVSFHAGDVRRPYVVGALWNGQDSPPESMDGSGNNYIKSITTASGHKLKFDDTTGATKITLTTQQGFELVLDEGSGQVTLQSPRGGSVVIDPTGNVNITGSAEVTIAAGQLNVNAAMSQFSGIIQCNTIIADAVVGTSYTPGAGNIW